jgi:calmodulin
MQEKLQEAFYNFDDEKQGYLSIDDLRYIVTSDGNPLTGADLEEFLQEADIFKNGVVDYKAFAALLLSEDV